MPAASAEATGVDSWSEDTRLAALSAPRCVMPPRASVLPSLEALAPFRIAPLIAPPRWVPLPDMAPGCGVVVDGVAAPGWVAPADGAAFDDCGAGRTSEPEVGRAT